MSKIKQKALGKSSNMPHFILTNKKNHAIVEI